MNKKIEIIPAVLPKDFAELDEKISLVKGLVKFVQIDICDGQFTPEATWPYRKDDDNFERIQKEESGLPGWEKLDFEIDLMVNKPDEVVEQWITAGASRIIIHAESGERLSVKREGVKKAIEILAGRLEVGLALNIETPMDIIETYKDKIQFVQCMGIDNIGFQGQDFDAKVIDKIKEIKTKYPELIVSVDGAVSLESAPMLVEAGADRLVVGSAIFNSDNFTEAIREFKAVGRV